jgi:hypothetical protein
VDPLEPPKEKSVRLAAIERAANDHVAGLEAVEPCPQCGAVLEVKVIRPDVLVRCPNGCIDAHRRLVSDPGWSMRLGFLLAAAIILGLGLVRRFYFEGRPDPHAAHYETETSPPPGSPSASASPSP